MTSASEPTQPTAFVAAREEIPALARHIPLNNCSQGPLSARVSGAVERFMASWGRDGMDWEGWVTEVEAARATFAALIGAASSDIAVFSSVSHATSALASALDFGQPRRRVLLTDGEFPSVAQVWHAQVRRGARTERVDLGTDPVEAIESALDGETLLVSAAHGHYATGTRVPIGRIAESARAQGALTFVDAYQTVGTTSIDVNALGVDFLAAGTLKYLLGTAGIAFLYIRREVAEQLEPSVTGWFGRRRPFDFDPWTLDWADGARRFDGGTPPLLPAYVARAGMDWIRELGPESIGDWINLLSRALVSGGLERGFDLIGPADPDDRTPVTAFRTPGGSGMVEQHLRSRGVLASARGEAIRLAPHFFTTRGEVGTALDALAESLEAVSRESLP